jgi:hypothetical protein
MHIVALAWIFVVVLMALAEATSTQGSLLGALITLLLYGALPLGIVLYVLGTPARARARRAAAPQPVLPVLSGLAVTPDAPAAPSAEAGDAGGQATGAGLAPEREEP